jgi:hypothetical protein
MITLRINDQTYAKWSQQAAERGLSVEDWLKTETESRRGLDSPEAGEALNDAPALPADASAARLDAIAMRHRPTEFPVDTSRESIYD